MGYFVTAMTKIHSNNIHSSFA